MAARLSNKLDPATVRKLLKDGAKPGRYSDGGGLYLSVGSGGARRWVVLFQWRGRRREMGLGSAKVLGISDARELAREARRKVALDEDPIAARNAIRARPTFKELATTFLEENEKGWTNFKHRQQWRKTLLEDAAALGPMRVDTITIEDVLNVLRPIWHAKHETASRLRGRIERVLNVALSRGYITGPNPARWRGGLDGLLAKPKQKPKNHAALPYKKAPEFFRELSGRGGTAARALQFLILTASRSGEVRGATWDEFDLEERVWRIPGERMKMDREHRVPLSDYALEIIKEQKQLTDALGVEWVFPSPKNGQLSENGMSAALRRMGVPAAEATVHGFRSTFRDWAFEQTSHSREVIEISLAHSVGDRTERAYRRGAAVTKRMRLLEDWAGFLSMIRKCNVTLLRAPGE